MSLVIDYTSGFFEAAPTGETVGTSPAGDSSFSNVTLLLHGDGTNGSTSITDSSSSPKTVTVNGNAQIDTTIKKFGTGSIEFDGTNSNLTLPSGLIGSGDFTIEYWVYGDATSGNSSRHLDFGGTNRLIIYYQGASTTSAYDYSINVYDNNAGNQGVDNSLTLGNYRGNWNHVAVVKGSTVNNNGPGIALYLNGTKKSSRNTALDFTDASLTIGSTPTSSSWLNGFLDDIRITNGVARYTSNFTPPTAPFLDTGPAIDATTGNVFNHAPSADVAYAFTNPPSSGTSYDFTLKVTPSATVAITWPASVEWPSGTAPAAPASGETDVYTFFTTDGGSTYYGNQVGDAVS